MELSYGNLALKLTIGFLFMVIQINLFGKSNIAPTSAIDQLQNYVLGGIVGGMIYNSSITTFQFTLVLIIWTLIVFIAKFLSNHNVYFRRMIIGSPKMIIKNGKIDVDLALRNGLSAADLSFKLRTAGVTDISNVKRAVFEQNGQLTIIMNDEENIKYPVVLDGKINTDELEMIGRDPEWVEARIKEQDLDIADIYLANYINGKIVAYTY
ncbi:DUF421 domain-containing protein [Companilactobacillus sp. HBUAS59699]|uniref:DUF421 domain-containing protein n=1 Tax=Companilactobacillus sp. HBUAS59699 TaxID=3109358 RepID=UPI002FEF2CE9